VELGVAFRASSVGIEARSEDSAAVGAARAGDGADHARRARAEVIVLSAWTAGGRPLFGTCFSVFFFRIAVTAMAVLTVHKRLRASGLLLAGQRSLAATQDERNRLVTRQTCTYKTGKQAAIFVVTLVMPGCLRPERQAAGKLDLSNRIATLGLATDTAFRFQKQRSANVRDAGDGTTLFVTLWEFEVKSGCEELFEQAYGPEGRWVELFARDARYRGTRLLRDLGRERVYVTVDKWESREAYEAFREKYAADYARLDAKCDNLTVREESIGHCVS
jgi:heme-degrading monooxygenase HmoA